ncbi:TetR/AcrR family transcriptional regulator [Humibacillus xanthopallidus]|uniref:TetR family transcriptional regulator n=1 Tax=Humibacillus xanthopallidus TaxID=412689 RepID=A0A543HI64_9MICO|nr:TetR/AcrR family transcriptional regulator [Humibacillus xanthopallidus]TQM58016.1 TetR family transcriptional regulator [Humibacillus xanthopallidus]
MADPRTRAAPAVQGEAPTAGDAPNAPDDDDGRDGRDVRWERHREERRSALVDATIRAIRRHGPGVGMDDIAAEAGTSKTVVYRHFDDRAGLYRAVVARIESRVVGSVAGVLSTGPAPAGPDLRRLIASTVEAYLALVESDPDLYRFVVTRPLVDRPLPDDPVGGTVSHVTAMLSGVLEAALPAPGQAHILATALVGSVQAVADDWLGSSDRVPRDTLVATLTDLAWSGLAPLVR